MNGNYGPTKTTLAIPLSSVMNRRKGKKERSKGEKKNLAIASPGDSSLFMTPLHSAPSLEALPGTSNDGCGTSASSRSSTDTKFYGKNATQEQFNRVVANIQKNSRNLKVSLEHIARLATTVENTPVSTVGTQATDEKVFVSQSTQTVPDGIIPEKYTVVVDKVTEVEPSIPEPEVLGLSKIIAQDTQPIEPVELEKSRSNLDSGSGGLGGTLPVGYGSAASTPTKQTFSKNLINFEGFRAPAEKVDGVLDTLSKVLQRGFAALKKFDLNSGQKYLQVLFFFLAFGFLSFVGFGIGRS